MSQLLCKVCTWGRSNYSSGAAVSIWLKFFSSFEMFKFIQTKFNSIRLDVTVLFEWYQEKWSIPVNLAQTFGLKC